MRFRLQHLQQKIALALFPALAACTHAPVQTPKVTSGPLPAWTQLGPGGKLLARALVQDGTCPALEVTTAGTKASVAMAVRGARSAEFPLTTCEARLSAETAEILLAGVRLPVLKREPSKILVLGDTGCRIKRTLLGTINQGCNDPRKWPFAEVARRAAAERPDLIIHVGDYHYREAECPSSDAGCRGVVSGDNWESWRQDFFAPAEPLLASAPWLFVRGNHENCERAGKGWALALSAQDFSGTCSRGEPEFDFAWSNLRFAVVDAAYESNIAPSLARLTLQPRRWLLIHRPILSDTGMTKSSKGISLRPGTANLVMAGHIHSLSLNRFADGRPPEFVVGNGGANLDPKKELGFLKASQESVFRDYGYLTFERSAPSEPWRVRAHDLQGRAVLNCLLVEPADGPARVTCEPNSPGLSD